MLEPLLGIEPRTIDYKSIVIPFNYRGLLHAWMGSNHRHLVLETSALPTELQTCIKIGSGWIYQESGIRITTTLHTPLESSS